MDLVIRGFDAGGDQVLSLFVENKYNPKRVKNPYWFSKDQARRQRAALKAEPLASEKRLIGIASRSDVRRAAPRQYETILDWRTVEDVANDAGGNPEWRRAARSARALASDRVLLEFVTYLKGDAVGNLEAGDLEVLARTVLVEERLQRLLERAAESLDEDWDDDVGANEWFTPSGMPIFYVVLEPPDGSWLHARRDGSFYLFVSDAEWSDERSVGEPTLYAGAGWSSKREERAALSESAWPATAEKSKFQVLSDSGGNYVVRSRPLRELIAHDTTLSEQAENVALWARQVMDAVLQLSAPPDPDRKAATSKRSRARSAARPRA